MTNTTFTDEDRAVIDSFQWLTVRHRPGCTGRLTVPAEVVFMLVCSGCDLIAHLREERPPAGLRAVKDGTPRGPASDRLTNELVKLDRGKSC